MTLTVPLLSLVTVTSHWFVTAANLLLGAVGRLPLGAALRESTGKQT